MTVSSQKGCPMHCNFCDCPKLGFKGNASLPELMMEITSGIALSGIRHGERLNVHYARMGEPTFNQNVIASAKQIAHMLADPDSDIHFNTYHPVISTMMPKANNNLKEFLHKWVKTGFEYGGEDGFGLQFSINTLNEEQRNEILTINCDKKILKVELLVYDFGDIHNELDNNYSKEKISDDLKKIESDRFKVKDVLNIINYSDSLKNLK